MKRARLRLRARLVPGEPAAAPAQSRVASPGRLVNRDPAARSRLVPRPSRRDLLLVPGLCVAALPASASDFRAVAPPCQVAESSDSGIFDTSPRFGPTMPLLGDYRRPPVALS